MKLISWHLHNRTRLVRINRYSTTVIILLAESNLDLLTKQAKLHLGTVTKALKDKYRTKYPGII